MFKKHKRAIFFLILIFLIQCSKTDPVTGEKVNIEPDPVKKAREMRGQIVVFLEILEESLDQIHLNLPHQIFYGEQH